ncbi:hypothetical protein B0H19DRAFT_1132293 [Mycena capillaripes]|nr:hypothetical protein B0H19DRAFT_1132293 [Mycena capillaripes]
MTFKCRQCPQREFNSRTALFQHYRQSTGHPFCLKCDKYFNDQEQFQNHKATDHPEFECTLCKVAFYTQSSLDDHFRGKATHPNCPRCHKGFFNQQAAAEHFKAAHPLIKCSCGCSFYQEEFAHHYVESPQHPKCMLCIVGFKDDDAYNAHGATEHPDRRCTVCERQFTNKEELKEHFNVSVAHPKCPKCKLGFIHDVALNEHFMTEHALPKQIQLAHAPPAPHKDLLAIEDVPNDPRPAPALLPRPGKEVNELWRSTQNQVLPQAPFESVSTTSTALVHAGSSAGIRSKAWGLDSGPGEALHSNARLFQNATAAVKHDPTSRRQITSGERPIQVHKVEQESWMSLSKRSLVEPSAGAPTPVHSYEGSSIKTISPQSSTSSFHSSSFVELSEGSSGRVADTSHGPIVRPTTRLRCMVCSGACIAPTATMCGHVFCEECITKSVIQAQKCPKCSKATLLYCLFSLHLD